MSWAGACAVALLFGGCSTDLGECDTDAAKRVVYTDDSDGLPAYEGQALVIRHCSGCHAEGIAPISRHGAPFGLDFGVGLVGDAFDTVRLARAHDHVLDNAGTMFDDVRSRKMPPGEAGENARGQGYVDDTDAALPEIDTPAGQEILRNWLACGAPVVETIDPTADLTIGDYMAPRCQLTLCGTECVDPQVDRRHCGDCDTACPMGQVCDAGACVPCAGRVGFAEDVQPIFGTTMGACAVSGCHVEDSGLRPEAGIDLSPGMIRTSLIGVETLCEDGSVYITPGNPDASYLVNKLRGVGICDGVRMPYGLDPLSPTQMRAIETWICAGALDD